jgi:hypothetical protein
MYKEEKKKVKQFNLNCRRRVFWRKSFFVGLPSVVLALVKVERKEQIT